MPAPSGSFGQSSGHLAVEPRPRTSSAPHWHSRKWAIHWRGWNSQQMPRNLLTRDPASIRSS